MKKTLSRALAVLLCVLMLATTLIFTSAASYNDVKKGDWYEDFVGYMSKKDIINGYTDNTFRPNDFVKRCEFIKMMVEAFGLTTEADIDFEDVNSNDWYYTYYRKAAAQGFLGKIFKGTKMEPQKYLTREEAAGLLMAYLNYSKNAKASESTFADFNTISAEYKDYVLQAAKAGIINGFEKDGVYNFRPTETLRRAQAAKILSVSAGTIADKDMYDELEFDGSDNLTVTAAVTLTNIYIPGNVIISEGITNGTVKFVNCTIGGNIYDRSTANVEFKNNGDVVVPDDTESSAPDTESSAPDTESSAPDTESSAPDTESSGPETEDNDGWIGVTP